MKVDGKDIRPIWLDEDLKTVKVIDQRRHPHEFIFANSKELETSRNHPTHLQQNYFLDILITGKKDNFTLSEPWSFDFNSAFDSLENPINASEMNIDERATILE